jgi:1,2-phenylacetyl-CoA epoxidase catalytic subunit
MPPIADKLPAKYHDAVMAWQRRHFEDYAYLLQHWGDFYKQAPFELTAKLDDLKSDVIEVGEHAGRRKFMRAADMDEETLDQVRKIIRAQASTELGSIQQHRESLHKAQDPKLQFDVLRVMAEEFRHGYQMIYLLASDDWGGGDVAMDSIEELLEMRTGAHVLDAFNVFFDSFVDNIVFAALIDRVGKYQLTMQKVFAYAPMARSMAPMLTEEAFHLAAGVNPLRRWVREEGNVSLATIQSHLNKWFPRALEMFGDERGGATNVRLGLKDLTNGEAVERYAREVQVEVIDRLNREIPREEDRLRLPATSFFRRRGVHAFEMNDLDGRAVADPEAYARRLRSLLPEAYISGRDFSHYLENLRRHRGGEEIHEAKLPFFG